LTGQASFVTAVVVQPGEVLVVPVERLRELVLEDVALSDVLLRAYRQRRSVLIEGGVGSRILGSCYSPDMRRLRELAARNRLPHRFVDLDQDAGAESLVRQLGVTPGETPVVVWRQRWRVACSVFPLTDAQAILGPEATSPGHLGGDGGCTDLRLTRHRCGSRGGLNGWMFVGQGEGIGPQASMTSARAAVEWNPSRSHRPRCGTGRPDGAGPSRRPPTQPGDRRGVHPGRQPGQQLIEVPGQMSARTREGDRLDHDTVGRAGQPPQHGADLDLPQPRSRCRHRDATGRVS
jgi:hypothetical protein